MLYFDTHATSYPKPEAVQKAVAAQLSAPPPSREQASALLTNCRKKLLQFFGAGSGVEAIFTSGSTEGLNLVIAGLPLRPNAQIVSSVTEHNSVLRPLHALHLHRGATYRLARCCKRGYIDLGHLRELCKKNDTLAILVNHASNVTGALQPLGELCQIAQEFGAFLIVDASQSAGAVDIDLQGQSI